MGTQTTFQTRLVELSVHLENGDLLDAQEKFDSIRTRYNHPDKQRVLKEKYVECIRDMLDNEEVTEERIGRSWLLTRLLFNENTADLKAFRQIYNASDRFQESKIKYIPGPWRA